MKILISGAGIAGIAAAFWLSKLGHNVVVLERFPSLRTTGLQIDLRGHGIQVLKHMGLHDAFRALSVSEQGLQLVDKMGKRCAFFPANKSGKGTQSFTSEYEIMRGDLCRLLHDACKDRVTFVFGTSIKSFNQLEDSVHVIFADDTSQTFDLLIGADGQHSHTRKLMRGPNAADVFLPLSDNIAYFTIPRPAKANEDYVATMYLAPGQRGIMTRRSKPEEIQVYLGCKANAGRLSSVPRGAVTEQKNAMAEIFQGAGWESDEILRSMQDAENFYFERIGLVKLDSWSSGRVVLVGDAAYCPSVNTGMGTTSSILGAYILAGEIGKYCSTSGSDERGESASINLTRALASYQAKFQPFMDQVQHGVTEEKYGMPTSAMGIRMFNLAMKAMAFLKINVGAWFLKEDVKGWDLPLYDQMLKD